MGLIVDDEEDLTELYKTLFAGAGVECFVAHGGYQAFQILENNHDKIKFVLTDLSMAEGDGIWLLNRVKTEDDDIKKIKIYMMSAFSEWTKEELVDQGASGFYRKPFNISQMIREITSQVEN